MSATVNILEVATHIGVVVLNVITILLHCGGLQDDEQLLRLPVTGLLTVSVILLEPLYCNGHFETSLFVAFFKMYEGGLLQFSLSQTS